MQQRGTEIAVGLFMILGVLAFIMLAFKISGLTTVFHHESYAVTADFDNIGGLKVRAPVKMAGVSIGQVTAIDLDRTNYRAKVFMQIDDAYNKLPDDSSMSVFTEGLLGANYISVTPGFDEAFLKAGSHVQETHAALVLENLIGQFLFSMKEGNKEKKQ
ncbi:MAG: putative phospholipid ABC transporter-binding protein MlaD [marine bacterium B5-7]|nr:MAG: putative phospholipid ABC transporter-binding protein MlaD [marine bacterium B5-7]